MRFRLRTLLLSFVVVAIGCYWIMRPTIVAERLVAQIADRQYNRLADIEFADGLRFGQRFAHDQFANVKLNLLPLSFRDLAEGQRRLTLEVRFREGHDWLAIHDDLVANRQRVTVDTHRAIRVADLPIEEKRINVERRMQLEPLAMSVT
jgi:hypothetical protein